MLYLSSILLAVNFLVGWPNLSAYPYQQSFSKLKANVDCENYPTILSWHVHVTYMLTNGRQIVEVTALRDEATKYFRPFLGADPICQGTDVEPSGRYDNGRLCVIYDHNLTNDTLGPFAVGEWSMFVPVHYYQAVVPWFVQHRGRFNLLVHPNTGCENEDHSIWAQWTGSAWNMDMSIFTPWTQTNEFGEVLGTEKNPSCAVQSTVCAFGDSTASGFGPQVPCCSGLSCNCDSAYSTGHCVCK